MKLYRKNARIEILKKIVKENTGKYMWKLYRKRNVRFDWFFFWIQSNK